MRSTGLWRGRLVAESKMAKLKKSDFYFEIQSGVTGAEKVEKGAITVC